MLSLWFAGGAETSQASQCRSGRGSWTVLRGTMDALTPSLSLVLKAQPSLFLPFVPALVLPGGNFPELLPTPSPVSLPILPSGCEVGQRGTGPHCRGVLWLGAGGVGALLMDTHFQPCCFSWFPFFSFSSSSRSPRPEARLGQNPFSTQQNLLGSHPGRVLVRLGNMSFQVLRRFFNQVIYFLLRFICC